MFRDDERSRASVDSTSKLCPGFARVARRSHRIVRNADVRAFEGHWRRVLRLSLFVVSMFMPVALRRVSIVDGDGEKATRIRRQPGVRRHYVD